MNEPKRTPGQAEGSEEQVEDALNEGQQSKGRAQQREDLDQAPGRTPGQAEGTEEQADGSLRDQK